MVKTPPPRGKCFSKSLEKHDIFISSDWLLAYTMHTINLLKNLIEHIFLIRILYCSMFPPKFCLKIAFFKAS